MTNNPSINRIHNPVMLMESIENLQVKKNGIYIDGTLGLGGHSKEILKNIESGLLIGIDRDYESVMIAKNRLSSFENFQLYHDNYKNFHAILASLGIEKVDGILLDLGLSSYQLEDNGRGFSHKFESELDMRFDKSNDGMKAEDLIEKYSVEQLKDIFKQFGEERYSYKIAKLIKESDKEINVENITKEIDRVTPTRFRLKTYSRIFQALRIETNDELKHLEDFLNVFIEYLKPGGRIVIISYHSVEDRIVKHSFKNLKLKNELNLIVKKPMIPSDIEVAENKRSRSAKMRIGEKNA